MNKNDLFDIIEKHRDTFIAHAVHLWENPELSYEEKQSSVAQKKLCCDLGFNIEELDSIQPHAFVAEFGSGSPTIGFLGEFDALPGLSQKIAGERIPIKSGAPGHGCGHNLLGTACLAAATSVMAGIRNGSLKGRVRYFGCPAEEQFGKATLARAGLFNFTDAVLCWHPADINTVAVYGTNAAVQLEFEFRGKSAHAAQGPHLGRSALDALTLMNVATEFLREHVPPTSKIHYIVSAGGERPNIVPEYAAGMYQLRCPKMGDVVILVSRVADIARGAALMTGTEVKCKFINGCHDFAPNKVISDILYRNIKIVPRPVYSVEERDLADKLFATNNEVQRLASLQALGIGLPDAADLAARPLHESIGYWGAGWTIPASTDVGDVSHIAPTGQINAVTWPIGVGTHTWQATAGAGSGIGMKGMIFAAKTLAGAAWDMMQNPEYIRKAGQEFATMQRQNSYRSAGDLIAHMLPNDFPLLV